MFDPCELCPISDPEVTCYSRSFDSPGLCVQFAQGIYAAEVIEGLSLETLIPGTTPEVLPPLPGPPDDPPETTGPGSMATVAAVVPIHGIILMVEGCLYRGDVVQESRGCRCEVRRCWAGRGSAGLVRLRDCLDCMESGTGRQVSRQGNSGWRLADGSGSGVME